MTKEYFLYFWVFLICLALRAIYEILKKSGKIDPKSKPLFIVLLIVMCLLWTSWFAMCPEDPYHLAIPDFWRQAGFALSILGIVLAVGSFIQLRGVENIDHLETGGIFAKIRHPMYLGFIFWIVGWAIYNRAGLSTLPGFIGIANVLYWRRLEEAHLEKTYGERYREYRKGTWF